MLRGRLLELAPNFSGVDKVTPAAWGAFGTAGNVSDAPFVSTVADFYLTNPIARASATMAECSAIARGINQPKTGTHD
jgi:NADH-quinone oxidoreductase subunit G